KKYLGETIDIHAGGLDLTFPHHENEIAQSEAKTGKTFANYWMHNGYINIDNKKMSKSLGNFVFTRDLIKAYDSQVFRFLILSVHYRNPINFTVEPPLSAAISLDRIQSAYMNLEHRNHSSMNLDAGESAWLGKISSSKEEFEQALDDNLNTANAI